MKNHDMASSKRIVVIGFDGLSPEIIEPMIEENKLPNFARLKDTGSYAPLATTNPSQSPVAWSGFATGRNPGKHGVFDFIVRDPKTYSLRLSLTRIEKGEPKRVIRGKCFWQYLSEKKVPVVVLGCPVTFPPDRINGRMLSGMGVPDILGTEGTFAFYTSQSAEKDRNAGGNVFRVERSPIMRMHLPGPRILSGQEAKNALLPFQATLADDGKSIEIECQEQKFRIGTGAWSGWKELTFDLGRLRKTKGICRFYLEETDPDIKLYVSPVNFDPRRPLFPISHPESYSKELADAVGLYYTQGMPFPTWAVNEGRLSEAPFLTEACRILEEKRALLDFELDRFTEGVLFCYFESPDIIQHMFWSQRADAVSPYARTIEDWYGKTDESLGRILRRLNPQDVLIVLSDHGFGAFRRAVHLNTWLRENGYLKLKNDDAPNGRELLADVDWRRTRAYAVGFGAIYLNETDRERNGIVAPGREAQLLKEEIAGRLKKWRDEKCGFSVVSEVYRREDIFRGEYAGETPDLYVGFNKGYRASWQTALGAAPADPIEDNAKKWSGDHLFDPKLIPGVLFSNLKIAKETPSIYDITPTLLKAAGFSDEELKRTDFDGAPLF
ncbi:MAG: alkaline phosphatase family protein [Deltaproteobacteria bacterium]